MSKGQSRGAAEKLLGELLRKKGTARMPELQDIAGEFIRELGGPGAFARQMVTDYKAAPAGSMQRAKILDTILRGLKPTGDAVDLGKLDEEDLRRLLSVEKQEYEELLNDEPAGPTAGPAEEGEQSPAAEGVQSEGEAAGPVDDPASDSEAGE